MITANTFIGEPGAPGPRLGGDIMDRRFLEHMVREGVARKVLFGSDYPWLDQRAHLACVYLADISTEAKRLILHDNARGVFGLPQG